MEPEQTTALQQTVYRDVPSDMICRAYHICGLADDDFPAYDLLTDILANGKSARFYRDVVAQNSGFSMLDASVEANIDPGLLLLSARLTDALPPEKAVSEIDKQIKRLLNDGVSDYELQKCVNKYETAWALDNLGYQARARQLCMAELLGDANAVNTLIERYRRVTTSDIVEAARRVFREQNASTLFYLRASDNADMTRL